MIAISVICELKIIRVQIQRFGLRNERIEVSEILVLMEILIRRLKGLRRVCTRFKWFDVISWDSSLSLLSLIYCAVFAVTSRNPGDITRTDVENESNGLH